METLVRFHASVIPSLAGQNICVHNTGGSPRSPTTSAAAHCQGVSQGLWGLAEPLGVCRTRPGVSRTRSQNPLWGFGEPSGVGLPSTNLSWVQQTSAYPWQRTHREVYTYNSFPNRAHTAGGGKNDIPNRYKSKSPAAVSEFGLFFFSRG